MIPQENKKDIEEIPENIRKAVKLIPVSQGLEVLKYALVNPYSNNIVNRNEDIVFMNHAAEEAAVTLEN